MYTTPYGPIVDGVVVPADPQLLMADPGAGNNYPRYDIMFGLTESESFHLFPASTGILTLFYFTFGMQKFDLIDLIPISIDP